MVHFFEGECRKKKLLRYLKYIENNYIIIYVVYVLVEMSRNKIEFFFNLERFQN